MDASEVNRMLLQEESHWEFTKETKNMNSEFVAFEAKEETT